MLMVIAALALATMTACAGKPAEETIREYVTAELDSIKNIVQKTLDELKSNAWQRASAFETALSKAFTVTSSQTIG